MNVDASTNEPYNNAFGAFSESHVVPLSEPAVNDAGLYL